MASPGSNNFEQSLERTGLAVGEMLSTLLPDTGLRLHQAMRYALLGPGKRLRPFLLLECHKLLEPNGLDAMRAAAALECVHCYSLVHDDLPSMDNDDLRRGRPTLHRQFDEATAILAGDALLTLSFEILASPQTHSDGGVRSQLIAALAQASGEAGMVGGQMLDIEAETRNFGSLAEISAMQSKKTGALFRFACEAPALAAGQDAAALRQYADHLGLAFQIADDILDVESTSETLGKATQKDKARGKATFVDFLGLDGAKREAERLSQAAAGALDRYGTKADVLRQAARFIVSRRK